MVLRGQGGDRRALSQPATTKSMVCVVFSCTRSTHLDSELYVGGFKVLEMGKSGIKM